MKKVAIIGAGISGLFIANLFKKNSNYQITIYEKSTSVNLEEGYGIQLSVNSIKLLNEIKFNELQNDEKFTPHKINFYSERDPNNLPWRSLKVDVVLECTGFFASKPASMAHINAGAKKVLISAPAKEVDATVVYGVNHDVIKPSDQVVSNASCTTNCLATLIKDIHEKLNIENGIMTTIHSYTNDQVLTEVDAQTSENLVDFICRNESFRNEKTDMVFEKIRNSIENKIYRMNTYRNPWFGKTVVKGIKIKFGLALLEYFGKSNF